MQEDPRLTPHGPTVGVVTLAVRLKVAGVLVLALGGLLMSATVVLGVIPATPPAQIASALADLETALVLVKVAIVVAALVTFFRSGN